MREVHVQVCMLACNSGRHSLLDSLVAGSEDVVSKERPERLLLEAEVRFTPLLRRILATDRVYDCSLAFRGDSLRNDQCIALVILQGLASTDQERFHVWIVTKHSADHIEGRPKGRNSYDGELGRDAPKLLRQLSDLSIEVVERLPKLIFQRFHLVAVLLLELAGGGRSSGDADLRLILASTVQTCPRSFSPVWRKSSLRCQRKGLSGKYGQSLYFNAGLLRLCRPREEALSAIKKEPD